MFQTEGNENYEGGWNNWHKEKIRIARLRPPITYRPVLERPRANVASISGGGAVLNRNRQNLTKRLRLSINREKRREYRPKLMAGA